jgi:hypothetical protein
MSRRADSTLTSAVRPAPTAVPLSALAAAAVFDGDQLGEFRWRRVEEGAGGGEKFLALLSAGGGEGRRQRSGERSSSRGRLLLLLR